MRVLKFENMLKFDDIRYDDFLKADETFILIFTERKKFTKIHTNLKSAFFFQISDFFVRNCTVKHQVEFEDDTSLGP